MVQAFVHPHGTCGFGVVVLVDQAHVPGSPSDEFDTLEAAAKAAKALFTAGTLEILQRV